MICTNSFLNAQCIYTNRNMAEKSIFLFGNCAKCNKWLSAILNIQKRLRYHEYISDWLSIKKKSEGRREEKKYYYDVCRNRDQGLLLHEQF